MKIDHALIFLRQSHTTMAGCSVVKLVVSLVDSERRGSWIR